MNYVKTLNGPLIVAPPPDGRRISFAKGMKPSDAEAYDMIKNSALTESLARSIVETIIPKFNSLFHKQVENVEIKVLEPTYPYFTDAMKLAYPHKKPRSIMVESDAIAGLTNSETGSIFINKEFILKNNPRQPDTQRAFFTLTVIHELLHLYGGFIQFDLKNKKGHEEIINTEFLDEGITELVARAYMRLTYPDYMECVKAERLGTNERIYGHFLDIAEDLEFLLGSSILLPAFSDMNAEDICRHLSKIDESAALELFRSASTLSSVLYSDDGKPNLDEIQQLDMAVHAALARLKKKKLDSGLKFDKTTRQSIIDGLRNDGVLIQKKFDASEINSINDLNNYVTGLFPSSSDYDRYVLCQTSSEIAHIEYNAKQITYGMVGAEIYKYLQSFEDFHGVAPIEIERFNDFILDKKLSEYTGAPMPELDPYRKRIQNMLGEISSGRYSESDCVWLAKGLGFQSPEKNSEAAAYVFDLAINRLNLNNIFEPNRAEVAAFLLSFLESSGLSSPYGLEEVKKSLGSYLHQLTVSIGRKLISHHSADDILQTIYQYLRFTRGGAKDVEAIHLCNLLGICNSFVHPDRLITVDGELGVVRITREGLLRNPFEFLALHLPNNRPYIAVEKVR